MNSKFNHKHCNMCTFVTQDGIVLSQVSVGGGASTNTQQYSGTATNSYNSAAANTYNGAAANTYNSAATNTYNSAATNTYNAATANTYNRPNTYGTPSQGVGYNTVSRTGTATNQYNIGGQYGSSTRNYRQAASNQAYKGYSSNKFGGGNDNTHTRTSKRKMISLVLLLCAVVWICLGD